MEPENNTTVEILYVVGSSLDRKGKRVLIREEGCENTLWPGDDLQGEDVKLLIAGDDLKWIETFLKDFVGSA